MDSAISAKYKNAAVRPADTQIVGENPIMTRVASPASSRLIAMMR